MVLITLEARIDDDGTSVHIIRLVGLCVRVFQICPITCDDYPIEWEKGNRYCVKHNVREPDFFATGPDALADVYNHIQELIACTTMNG